MHTVPEVDCRHPIATWQRRFKPNLLLHIQKSETLCACATQPTTPRGADMCSYKFLLYLLIYNSLCISVRPPPIEDPSLSSSRRMNWHRGLLAPSPPCFPPHSLVTASPISNGSRRRLPAPAVALGLLVIKRRASFTSLCMATVASPGCGKASFARLLSSLSDPQVENNAFKVPTRGRAVRSPG